MNWFKHSKSVPDLLTSILYDEHTFYQAFVRDLSNCKKEVIIESPFITSLRMEAFYPIFRKILDRGIKIHIITRDPKEHDEFMKYQATNEILYALELGINVVLLTGYHHRKLAIIDKDIIWEGSLNILSQANSKEIMRRIKSGKLAKEMFDFLKVKSIVL